MGPRRIWAGSTTNSKLPNRLPLGRIFACRQAALLLPEPFRPLRQHPQALEPLARCDIERSLVRPRKRHVGRLAIHLDSAQILAGAVEDLNAAERRDVNPVRAIEAQTIRPTLPACWSV